LFLIILLDVRTQGMTLAMFQARFLFFAISNKDMEPATSRVDFVLANNDFIYLF